MNKIDLFQGLLFAEPRKQLDKMIYFKYIISKIMKQLNDINAYFLKIHAQEAALRMVDLEDFY